MEYVIGCILAVQIIIMGEICYLKKKPKIWLRASYIVGVSGLTACLLYYLWTVIS